MLVAKISLSHLGHPLTCPIQTGSDNSHCLAGKEKSSKPTGDQPQSSKGPHLQARGKGEEPGIRRAGRSPHPFKGLPWGQREEAEPCHRKQREEDRENSTGGHKPGVSQGHSWGRGAQTRLLGAPDCWQLRSGAQRCGSSRSARFIRVSMPVIWGERRTRTKQHFTATGTRIQDQDLVLAENQAEIWSKVGSNGQASWGGKGFPWDTGAWLRAKANSVLRKAATEPPKPF